MDLDPGRAEIRRRRLPFGSAPLAGPDRERDGRAWRAASLARLRPWASSRGARLEAREHLGQAPERDRLSHEVEGAEPQALLRLALVHPAGDHQGRDAQLANDRETQEIEPAHPGQADVEQDRVRTLRPERLERRFGAVHDEWLVADLAQKLLEDAA